MNIYQLRTLIGQEIVDYNQLKSLLSSYSYPRSKISEWLASGELIRVKKGLYVFGPPASRGPSSKMLLANLIYGPSALSLNYALAYYGLIPEAVHTLTSITNKKNKEFNTSIGRFTYRHLSKKKYSIGIQLMPMNDGTHCLIATPEKALCDVVSLTVRAYEFRSLDDIQQFLFSDLRIDEGGLADLDRNLLADIVDCYRNRTLNQFFRYFKQGYP